MSKPTIVKIGGSAITDKSKKFSIRWRELGIICDDLSTYIRRHGPIVLIHGGGSFGHPIVHECLKTKGYIDRECFTWTTYAMRTLNNLIMLELISRGVNVVSINPHTICRKNNSEFTCYLALIREFLELGMTPLLHGDVVISSGSGFEVISGDYLAWLLAKELNVKTLVFITDVEGIYDSDPKVNPKAKLIRSMKGNELLRISLRTSGQIDVTGGMYLKLTMGLRMGLKNVKVIVLSAKTRGNLFNALVGQDFIGTIVWY